MCLLRKIPQILHPEVLILNAYLIASWWQGPPWLRLETSSWPKAESSCDEASDEVKAEQKSVSIFNLFTHTSNDHLKDHRSVHPILILLHLPFRKTKTAEETIIRWVQGFYFQEEIRSIKKQISLPQKSITFLHPFIDEHGLVRVGGRLQNSQLPFNSKHPIILPSQHSISELLIKEQHIAHLHAGPTLLAHVLRQSHWIVGSRKLINKCIRKCLKCNKFKTSTTTPQLMGNLPKHRATLERPFFSCGIDYAGPSTKAVHIEAVGDLTTDSFIAALRRFSARRGAPRHIYSDDGTNFVGARRKLDEIRKLWLSLPTNEAISYYLSKSSINWHFIPPSSPHFEFQRSFLQPPTTEIVGSCYRTSNGAFGRSGVPNLSPSLQPRKKWQDAQPNLKEDDIVLIKEGPPGTWPMARVLQVHPGNDGLVRVATVKNPRLSA
ncbi:putative bel12 ag transposon polyprotein [Trichonephila clavipes]|nr:putative bel12 ag transposon polyprotein [Trichonephila clavipes]